MLRCSLILLLVALFLPDGFWQGRRGNARYDRGDYAGAAAAYEAGLKEATTLRARLWHNLGAARYRQGAYREGLEAFERAFQEGSREVRARAAYNAGNARYRLQDLEGALAYYREALLARPDDEQARFNYEFVRRRLRQQEKAGRQGSDAPEDASARRQAQGGEDARKTSGEAPPEGERSGPEPSPRSRPQQKLTPQQAEQILQALERNEKALLQQLMQQRVPPRRKKKDW